jgi:CRP/FNR family transcriptional regulator
MGLLTGLGQLPFFAGLDEVQLERLVEIARQRKLARGEVVFRQGEPVEGMFFLLEGRVKIFKLGPDGKEHILHIIYPGQGFAEAALFMKDGYPAWCESLAKSVVAFLPKDQFIKLLGEEPELSLAIIASMSGYLRRFAAQIEGLALQDVSSRLASWILDCSEQYERDFWDMEITKGQLASQLGTVGETLSRTLRKYRDAGWLEVRGRFMKILDRAALERVAAGDESGGI